MRWTRRLSIRWRITLGSALVAALLLVIAAVVFQLQIAGVLAHTDQELLESASAPYVAAVQMHPDSLDHPAEDQRIAVLDAAGHQRVDTLPDSLSDHITRVLALPPGLHTVRYGSTPYLVRVRPVQVDGARWHVIAAVSQGDSQLVLANLTNLLIIGAAILLLGFGIASWLVSRAALRPVDRMRAQAAGLTASGTYEPLPVDPVHDELHDLAVTLNAFVDAVRATSAREKQMVADASHELRTPLAVLQTQLEVAHLSEGDADALRADLGAAEASVARLSRVATGLLELSDAESTAPRAPSGWQELADEFVAASDRARLFDVDKSLEIEFDVDMTDPAPINDVYPIRPTQFGRILDNLVGNAVHATPARGRVHVRLRRDGGLRLTVEDDGPGMPEAFIPIAFDRFTRPDAARDRDAGGAGLGLSIVHALVAGAGGRVSLHNRAEGGLTATVTIPRSTR